MKVLMSLKSIKLDLHWEIMTLHSCFKCHFVINKTLFCIVSAEILNWGIFLLGETKLLKIRKNVKWSEKTQNEVMNVQKYTHTPYLSEF